MGVRLYSSMKTEREPLEFAVKRRELERRINTFQLDRQGLNDELAALSKIYVGDPNFQSMKQYLISYAQRRGQETVEEMNQRHQKEQEAERGGNKKPSFFSKLRSGDEYIGFMSGATGDGSARETPDQMTQRHRWERRIRSNPITPTKQEVLDHYQTLIDKERNIQRKSFLVQILKYFSNNFDRIRKMSATQLYQQQETDRAKQERAWVPGNASEKQRDKQEREAMERGEYDRVPLGANLRKGTYLFEQYETNDQQQVRQLMERRIVAGESKNDTQMKNAITQATEGLFSNVLMRSKFMKDLYSFYALQPKERLDVLKARQEYERDVNEKMNQKSLVTQEFTLFMY